MAKKICFLLPNLNAGGAERVVTILAESLSQKGFSVDIVLLLNNIVKYQTADNINIIKLNTEKLGNIQRIKILRNYLKGEKNKFEKMYVLSFQPWCLNFLLCAAFGLNIKIVATERNNPYRNGSNLYRRIKYSIPFILSDACVFQTFDAQKYYLFLKSKKCFVIPNPIRSFNNKRNQNTSPNSIVSFCRLHPQKNLIMAIDSIGEIKKAFPNVCLKIYGEGSIKTELEEYANKRGLKENVQFCGLSNNVPQIMANASLFLSTSDYEGISNSMLEAMSIGMPIVCTDCPIGGAKMMLQNGAGELVPVNDYQRCASKIIELFNKPSQMIMMGNKAFEESKKFSIIEISKRWLSVINHLG